MLQTTLLCLLSLLPLLGTASPTNKQPISLSDRSINGVKKIINLADVLTEKIKYLRDGKCADGGEYPCDEDTGKDTLDLDKLLELVKNITDALKDTLDLDKLLELVKNITDA